MKIGVVGAGSWGTALAKTCAEQGHQVTIWAYEPEVAEQISTKQCNEIYLPGIKLPPMQACTRLEPAVQGHDLILSVVPSHVVRTVWSQAASLITGEPIIVSATKGLEKVSLATMVEVLREVLPRNFHARLAALSGPSFAREVAERLPAVVVVAAQNIAVAEQAQRILSSDRLRIYTSDDVPGVEIGGTAKNVVAIAAGIADGLHLGNNTRAAIITRGLSEINRLAMAKAANPLTLAGLAGVGDLVLTCTGDLSRNRTVGLKLGQGQKLAQILSGMKTVAEGINSAQACYDLARRLGVEMPITEAVHDVLFADLAPLDALERLMGRELKSEL